MIFWVLEETRSWQLECPRRSCCQLFGMASFGGQLLGLTNQPGGLAGRFLGLRGRALYLCPRRGGPTLGHTCSFAGSLFGLPRFARPDFGIPGGVREPLRLGDRRLASRDGPSDLCLLILQDEHSSQELTYSRLGTGEVLCRRRKRLLFGTPALLLILALGLLERFDPRRRSLVLQSPFCCRGFGIDASAHLSVRDGVLFLGFRRRGNLTDRGLEGARRGFRFVGHSAGLRRTLARQALCLRARLRRGRQGAPEGLQAQPLPSRLSLVELARAPLERRGFRAPSTLGFLIGG